VLKTPSNSPISAGSGVSIPEMFIVLPSQTGSQSPAARIVAGNKLMVNRQRCAGKLPYLIVD
jgi:hypothetical protein